MLQSLSLNGSWKIRGFDGQHGYPGQVCGETCDERRFIEAQVPGDVHLDLERAGIQQDCNVGLNCLSARWVEEQVWVYRKTFDVPEAALQSHAWLLFEGLDLNAVIYLNGQEIGRHDNFFTPCRIDVSGKLRPGSNTLTVQIDSGLYTTYERPAAPYCPFPSDVLTKRAWLRKPQYSFSWDWSPRLITVGIWRGVRLEWTNDPRIDAVTVYPELAEDRKSAEVHARVFVDNPSAEAVKAVVRMRVDPSPALPHREREQPGPTTETEVELAPGVSRQDLQVTISNPKLWWPRPHGEQPLYNVICEVEVAGQIVDRATRRTGIRSVRICQDKHPKEGEYFCVEINGRKVFCKGGNWVPPDILPARVDPARYRQLVELAVGANFNALRIWGGGLYADHVMLDACDELGVLVWHDFIFACCKYPGDNEQFVQNVRREAQHIVRDLSPHPSLAIWCGNNEIEWICSFHEPGREKESPDYPIYHQELPAIVAAEDPSRPYWPSSPYSTDGRPANDYSTGDQHPWHVSLQEDGVEMWKYRENTSRFPNEGGVLGACSPATLKQFLPEDQWRLFSPVWEFHENACVYGANDLTYRFVSHWLGLDPAQMPFDDYIFYSNLIQAEGLQEYAHNFRRRMFDSASAIFWMYNDAWPASHSWTIIDYYLRKRLAYHPVRRAFQPVHVILAVEEDQVKVFGVNDTQDEWRGKLEYGLFTLQGEYPLKQSQDATLGPNQSTLLASIPMSEWEKAGSAKSAAFAVLLDGDTPVAQNRIFTTPFKDLEFAKSQISVKRHGDSAVFTSPQFAWGVCLDPDCGSDMPDDLFDLLPGVPHSVPWPAEEPLPKVKRCGSPVRVASGVTSG